MWARGFDARESQEHKWFHIQEQVNEDVSIDPQVSNIVNKHGSLE